MTQEHLEEALELRMRPPIFLSAGLKHICARVCSDHHLLDILDLMREIFTGGTCLYLHHCQGLLLCRIPHARPREIVNRQSSVDHNLE